MKLVFSCADQRTTNSWINKNNSENLARLAKPKVSGSIAYFGMLVIAVNEKPALLPSPFSIVLMLVIARRKDESPWTCSPLSCFTHQNCPGRSKWICVTTNLNSLLKVPASSSLFFSSLSFSFCFSRFTLLVLAYFLSSDTKAELGYPAPLYRSRFALSLLWLAHLPPFFSFL